MHLNTFPVLETKRLILRQLNDGDAKAIHGYLSDPDVIQYLEGSTDSVEETKGYLSWIQKGFKDGTDIRWGITLKSEGTLIGDCGLGHIDEPRRPTELGYMLDKSYWGRGYMSEALSALLAYGFEELGLHRIQAWTHPDNHASSHILERQGFKREGLLREYVYIWHKGIYIDTYMYAILNKDYKI